MHVITTLSFAGRTEEAIDFYRDAIGAEILFFMRLRDCPDPSLIQPGMEHKIFHAAFRIGQTEIKANDLGWDASQASATFHGFSLAIQADDVDRAEQMFKALSAGGTIEIPLAPASFTARYGIVIDRFGVSWKIMVA